MKNWFYKIKFEDGTIKLRKNVTKKMAHAALEFCTEEMLLLNIKSVEVGEMK